MQDDQFPKQQAWYKTAGGVAFLGMLGVLLVFLLTFGGFLTYYVYQIQQGNGAELAKQIQSGKNFSTSAGTDSGTISQAQDPSPYIRPHNAQFGNTSSPIKIIAFIDFECPFCQQAFPTFEAIREQYESGVHIIFKHFPIASIHPLATRAGLAASCAEEQDAFWPYYKKIFQTKALSKSALIKSATSVGMDTNVFMACLESERYQSYLAQDIRDGLDLGVRGTPTYFIGSKKLEGVVPHEVWNDEIISLLQTQ